MDPAAKIQLPHFSIRLNIHDVADLIVIQMKLLRLIMPNYIHS